MLCLAGKTQAEHRARKIRENTTNRKEHPKHPAAFAVCMYLTDTAVSARRSLAYIVSSHFTVVFYSVGNLGTAILQLDT